MVNSQQIMNWDHQQQYFEQMHMLNSMPSHLSPLSAESNQFYQQPTYQQPHHLMAHNVDKDSDDYVLIKVIALHCTDIIWIAYNIDDIHIIIGIIHCV